MGVLHLGLLHVESKNTQIQGTLDQVYILKPVAKAVRVWSQLFGTMWIGQWPSDFSEGSGSWPLYSDLLSFFPSDWAGSAWDGHVDLFPQISHCSYFQVVMIVSPYTHSSFNKYFSTVHSNPIESFLCWGSAVGAYNIRMNKTGPLP